MFELINQSMLFLLESLRAMVGNYGWAIVALTVLVRIALWPVSKSQMKSMKMMQELQPKMKILQERFKSDPQKLQAEMMKLYKDHRFNPLGGCLPMLIQLPLFLGLYGAISHPSFMATGDPLFLNVIHLKNTGIVSHGGPSHDGRMSLGENPGGGLFGMGRDALEATPKITVRLNNGKTITQDIPNAHQSLRFLPQPFHAGIPIQVSSSFQDLGLAGYEGLARSITLNLTNTATKETERLQFTPQPNASRLQATLETVQGKTRPHGDVLALVVIFALTLWLSQRMMTAQTQATGNAQQQQLMKMMPLMFTIMLFVFPIPAGVLLYMDTNSLFQLFQTWMFQRGQAGTASLPPSQETLDIQAAEKPSA